MDDLINGLFFPCLFAFMGCFGFSYLLNVRGLGILLCATGGALGWLVYLASAPVVHSDIVQAFLAALAISVWSEIMARLRKCPVTSHLLLALFPLVPGSNIYYTMEYAVSGEPREFVHSLLHTMGLAGALAGGMMVVASAVRLCAAHRQANHACHK